MVFSMSVVPTIQKPDNIVWFSDNSGIWVSGFLGKLDSDGFKYTILMYYNTILNVSFLYPSRLLFKFHCCLPLPNQGGHTTGGIEV